MHGVGGHRRSVDMEGGVLSSRLLGQDAHGDMQMGGGFSFVQISDSHIGFNKEANKDVIATLENAIARINELSPAPELLIHTGRFEPPFETSEFDTLDQVLRSVNVSSPFLFPANTMYWWTTASNFGSGTEKDQRGRVAKLRSQRRPFHWSGQRAQSESRRIGNAGRGTTGVAQERSRRTHQQHADCGVRSHPAVERLPGMGLGHGRRCGSSLLPEEIRIGECFEWPHPPGDAEGGRQHHFPHGNVDCVPTTCSGHSALPGPSESLSGAPSGSSRRSLVFNLFLVNTPGRC